MTTSAPRTHIRIEGDGTAAGTRIYLVGPDNVPFKLPVRTLRLDISAIDQMGVINLSLWTVDVDIVLAIETIVQQQRLARLLPRQRAVILEMQHGDLPAYMPRGEDITLTSG